MNVEAFEIASASVPGRDHLERVGLLIGRNNQDGLVTRKAPDGSWFVGIVCDGCGSSPRSDLGANLGALLVASAAEERLTRGEFPEDSPSWFEDIREQVLAELRRLANMFRGSGGSYSRFVADHLLFTVVGVVLTHEHAYIFNVGDGMYALNGEITELGPFEDNTPPYLAHSLVRTKFNLTPELLKFKVKEIELSELDSLLLGSDGVMHLVEAESKNVPGTTRAVGSLSQFWETNRYFKNSDALRRTLALMNSTVTRMSPERDRVVVDSGLLPDDTTMIVIRRAPILETQSPETSSS